jgi:HK97 family phage portal protein
VTKSKARNRAKAQRQGYSELQIVSAAGGMDALRYRARSEAYELWERALGQVDICANRKAAFVASQTMRLYRRSNKAAASTRAVSKAKRKYLTNPQRVGSKTAVWADQSADLEEVVGAPILRFIHKPNPFMSGYDLAYMAEYCREVTGNSYQYVFKGPDGNLQAWLLYPQYISLIGSEEEGLWGYAYGSRGEELTIPRESVFHQRYRPSRFCPFLGESPLHSILIQADALNEHNLRELAFAINGARPDFYVEVPLEATDTQMQETEDRINGILRGSAQAGKFIVTRNAKIGTLGFAPKDLENVNLRRDFKLDIANAYEIPESELAMNDANYSNSQQGSIGYLRGMQRLLTKIAEETTEYLVPLFYPDAEPGEFFFAFDDVLPPEATPTVAPEAQINLGLKTINEWRQENGYEALEGGDVLRYNGVPLALLDEKAKAEAQALGAAVAAPEEETQAQASEPAVETPEQAPAAEAAETASEDAKALARLQAKLEALVALQSGRSKTTAELVWEAAERWTPERVKSLDRSTANLAELRVDIAEAVRERRLNLCHKTELPYAKAEVARLQAAIEKAYKEALSSLSVASDGTVDLGDFEKALKESLGEPLAETFKRGGQDGLVRLARLPGGRARITDLGVSFDVVPKRAMTALERHVISLAREVSANQIDDLNKALRDGMEAGESISDLTKRVKESLSEETTWKAERIARTETARAYVNGQRAAWKECEVTKVRPLLAPDPCPECKARAEKYADGMDIDSDDLPPWHPNDRCDVAPVLD